MSELSYRVEAAHPGHHRFRVTLRVEAPAAGGQQVSLAAWTPGSYMIRDFARNVVQLSATRAGAPCQPEKLDKQTWLLPGDGPLEVCYELHAWDTSVRAAYLDLHRGFFDGACLFLRVHGQEDRPARVELCAPADNRCASWRLATAMRPESVDAAGFGIYRVDDYHELIDHPVEMGDFHEVRWQVGGIPHGMVLSGGFRMDEARLAADLEKICTAEIDLFGVAPFDRYLFMTHVTADGYGGLEHRASTALICARRHLPAPGGEVPDEKYREFLGLCSHEYFHAWNVKRIRPRALQEADLGSETYTRLLWVFEGFTSYYDELLLARSGVIAPEAYLELLGQTLTRVLRGAGRELQSVAESSFDAWTRFYKQDACSPNLIVSYYAKGALVALALDLHIRQATGDERSLDDVMRLLWRRHGQEDVGVPEDAMPALIEEATGVDVAGELRAWVDGTVDPPWTELLAAHGVTLHRRQESGMQDRGGTRPTVTRSRLVAGWRCEAEQGLVRIRHVSNGSPAGEAGLAPDDLLVALDGMQARADELDALLNRYRAGDTVQVHYLRDGMLRSAGMQLRAGPETTVWLEAADPARLRRWLGAPG